MATSLLSLLLSVILSLFSVFGPLLGMVGLPAVMALGPRGGSSAPAVPAQPIDPVKPATPTEPAQTEPAATAAPTEGPVWPIAEDGVWMLSTIDTPHENMQRYWTYREDGGLIGYGYSSDGGATYRRNEYPELDAEGFTLTSVSDSGTTSHSTYEYDAGGRMIRDTDDSGSISEYEYYVSGAVRQLTFTNGNNQAVTIYSEEGLAESYYNPYYQGGAFLTILYHYDDQGFVSGFTATYEGGEPREFTCSTDSYGNIIQVYDSDGILLMEATYEYIEHPGAAARLYAVVRTNGFVTRGMCD